MTQKGHEENDIDLGQAITEGKDFFEKYSKELSIGGGILIAAVALFSYYTKMYLPEKEMEAQVELFHAQNYLAIDSFQLAMYGNEATGTLGFYDIAEEFGATKAGNLSNYYMGACLMQSGEYEDAIVYLKDFNSNDEIAAAVAIGAIGDCYSELGDDNKAYDYYMDAANARDNDFSTPIYLMKAGQTAELLGNYDDAVSAYGRIKKEFSTSTEGRTIDKYLARAEAFVD